MHLLLIRSPMQRRFFMRMCPRMPTSSIGGLRAWPLTTPHAVPIPSESSMQPRAMRNALETDGLMIASARPNSAPGKQKTASDLADMIRKEINVPGIHVAVHEDPAFGWHPTVMSPPAQTGALQELAEAIAKVLRAQYDLKK
jgi:hypothetical protein